MKPDLKFAIVVAISIVAGLFLAWIDSRPGWDDTGITAGLIVIISALFGYLFPARPWIWAVTVSSWIPLHAIVLSGDFKMLLVSLFGFAGAYLGAAVKNNNPAEPM